MKKVGRKSRVAGEGSGTMGAVGALLLGGRSWEEREDCGEWSCDPTSGALPRYLCKLSPCLSLSFIPLTFAPPLPFLITSPCCLGLSWVRGLRSQEEVPIHSPHPLRNCTAAGVYKRYPTSLFRFIPDNASADVVHFRPSFLCASFEGVFLCLRYPDPFPLAPYPDPS